MLGGQGKLKIHIIPTEAGKLMLLNTTHSSNGEANTLLCMPGTGANSLAASRGMRAKLLCSWVQRF